MWDRLVAEAAQLERFHANDSHERDWNPQSRLLGRVGEWMYSEVSGQPMQPLRATDGGFDFPGLDAKAVPYFDRPLLMRHVDAPLKAPRYFLAALDMPRRIVRPVGYATRRMIREAPVFEYGNGPTHTLRERELLDLEGLLSRLLEEAR